MLLIEAAAKIVFDWRRRNFLMLVYAAMAVKTGIWHIPNIHEAVAFARDPFVLPTDDPLRQHLLNTWLSPFIAWAIGATSNAAFLLLHLGFAVAFSTLFTALCFRRLPEREARIAIVIFASLPASATAYFWVGVDGLTLLLMLAVVASDRHPLLAGLFGVALGLQHFEQGFVGLSTMLFAVLATLSLRHEEVYPWRTATAAWAGVVIGKIALGLIFWNAGMVVAGRDAWFIAHWRMMQEQFWLHTQVVLWAVLGPGWFVALRYADRGRASLPFFLALFGVMPLLMFIGDQTRVLAIVTFPLLFAFWLNQRSFLGEITRAQAGGLFLLWLVIPWIWVWGGQPRWSVFPYGIAYAVGKLTGWYELPAVDISNWPFR